MKKTEYIVIAFVNNQVSVLNRITSAYLKRHINIESLNVSESFVKGISTVVISANTSADTIEKVVNQLGNIVDVIYVDYYLQSDLICKELGLYKIASVILDERSYFEYILNRSNGRIIEINNDYIIMEKSGTRNELEKLKEELEKRNVLTSYSRSGIVVLHRESIENMFQKVS
ncbi:MAG: acetolactate synthase small subunit [Bacteroidetes bacterium GWF2_40_14]|jgi:acetolactate synthase-1/3 small subunit|nr:MAG: acetolactate synthase small subunit [Bacteroidetes bacterium GWF2_40_14]